MPKKAANRQRAKGKKRHETPRGLAKFEFFSMFRESEQVRKNDKNEAEKRVRQRTVFELIFGAPARRFWTNLGARRTPKSTNNLFGQWLRMQRQQN